MINKRNFATKTLPPPGDSLDGSIRDAEKLTCSIAFLRKETAFGMSLSTPCPCKGEMKNCLKTLKMAYYYPYIQRDTHTAKMKVHWEFHYF